MAERPTAKAGALYMVLSIATENILGEQLAPLVPADYLGAILRRILHKGRPLLPDEIAGLPRIFEEDRAALLCLPAEAHDDLRPLLFVTGLPEVPAAYAAPGLVTHRYGIERNWLHHVGSLREGELSDLTDATLAVAQKYAGASRLLYLPWPSQLSPRDVSDWLRENAPDQGRADGLRAKLDAGHLGGVATLAANAVAAWLEIQRDRDPAAYIALDANKEHQSLIRTQVRTRPALGRRAKVDIQWTKLKPTEAIPGRVVFEVPGMQLALFGSGDLIKGIRLAWGNNGIKHWLALLKLSTERGRKPRFVWMLEDHMRALGWSKRQREDRAARGKLIGTIEAFATIKVKTELNENRDLYEPLLKMHGVEVARADSKSPWHLDAVHFEIHPELYRGVRKESGKIGDNYGTVPSALLRARLEATPGLGALIAMRLQWDAKLGFTPLNGADLLNEAGLLGTTDGPLPEGARGPRIDKAMRKAKEALDELRKLRCIDRYEWKDAAWTLQGICRIYPPLATRERQELPAPKEHRTLDLEVTTGADLENEREKRGLTQINMAGFLGVSRRTYIDLVNRSKPLATKYRDRLKGLPASRRRPPKATK